MPKRSRPSLISLSGQVGSVSREAISAAETATDHRPPRSAHVDNEVEIHRASKFSAKQIYLSIKGAGWKEVSRLAQDLDKSIDALIAESLNDMLLKHGRPPVVEIQQPDHRDAGAPGGVSNANSSLLIWPGFAGAQGHASADRGAANDGRFCAG